jgi:hypothetical protein
LWLHGLFSGKRRGMKGFRRQLKVLSALPTVEN